MSPFFEGYKAAALESIGAPDAPLADETIAAMIRDCEAYCAIDKGHATGKPDYGRAFWENRQAGRSVFPPLTLSLGDGGKVHAREAS